MKLPEPFQRYLKNEPLTQDLFLAMCKAHDLTYSQSSDMRYYRLGKQTFELIEAAAKNLGLAKAVPIWNSVVAKQITQDYQSMYQWKMPT